MRILGINDSHDSGIAVLEDGKIKAAVNEERLSRIKLCFGLPILSISEGLKFSGLKPSDIDYIAIATDYKEFHPESFDYDHAQSFERNIRKLVSGLSPFLGGFLKSDFGTLFEKNALKFLYKSRQNKLRRLLKSKYGFKCPIHFIDHHLAHALSAYHTSGIDKALIITADAMGDGLSSIVAIGHSGNVEKLCEINGYNSIAKYYSYVTTICGFKSNRHEGKITGLAAYGKPLYLDMFRKMIRYNNGKIYNYSNSKHGGALEKIKKQIGDFKREHLAASIQLHVENEIVKFVEHWVDETGVKDVVLAGGLFANVKLNQRIHELKNVDSIFIHPHMGDGGLALGAAYQISNEKFGYYNKKLNHLYFGNSYSDEDIKEQIKKEVIQNYDYHEDIEPIVAELLAKGKVIARFNGGMEYGPRALGNRTILYQTTDKSVNDWLNKNLKRTEFMPFAPVTLNKYTSKCYKNMSGAEYPARFMTITFDCTDWMVENCPAVVHVDGTARPQVIDKEDNLSYYKIVEEYRKITGLPSLINTSFNMHEEPIVCTPNDAIRSFKSGHLDYLVIGNYLIKK